MHTELVQRLRLRFTKTGEMKFISHRDLMRLFERAVRRAELPIRMTSGFNPHPRISFPLALSLGVEATAEIVEMEFSRWVHPEAVKEALNRNLPPQIRVKSVSRIPPRQKDMVRDVTYEIVPPQLLEQHIRAAERLLGSTEFFVEREGKNGAKRVDIRRFILDIKVEDGKITAWVKVSSDGTVRPEELLSALGMENLPGVSVTRSSVNLSPRDRTKRRNYR